MCLGRLLHCRVHHSSFEAMQAAALSMEANSSNPSQSDTVQYNTPANVSGSARYVPRTGMGGHRSAADRIVRMRGMPFDASTSDILKFLDGLPVLNVVWSPSRTGKG